MSVGTDYMFTTGIYCRVLKWSSAPEAQVYHAAETQGRSSLRGKRNRCKYRVTGTEWRESLMEIIHRILMKTTKSRVVEVWRCPRGPELTR